MSRQKIRGEVARELEELGVSASPEKVREVVEDRLRDEIRRGVQTIQYQVVTLMTTNGQAPFVTVFMYLNEARTPQEKHDLAMIVEETLRQRYEGVKNEAGVWITPAFPKLIYVLEDDNVHENSAYFYLTQLAAKCTAKRMVPDYISEKKMRELKLSKGESAGNGDCYTCMGCRSFLTPDRSGNGFNNVANALNYDPTKPKYYGRFNQGVVTTQPARCRAELAQQDMDRFWKILMSALSCATGPCCARHERLMGTLSDAAPYPVAVRRPGAPLRRVRRSTSCSWAATPRSRLGYAGLYECVKYMTGHSHTDRRRARRLPWPSCST